MRKIIFAPRRTAPSINSRWRIGKCAMKRNAILNDCVKRRSSGIHLKAPLKNCATCTRILAAGGIQILSRVRAGNLWAGML